jgi:hypothetical protein
MDSEFFVSDEVIISAKVRDIQELLIQWIWSHTRGSEIATVSTSRIVDSPSGYKCKLTTIT